MEWKELYDKFDLSDEYIVEFKCKCGMGELRGDANVDFNEFVKLHIFTGMEIGDDVKEHLQYEFKFTPRRGKQSPSNHATPEGGSEDEPSEGSGLGFQRAEEGES